MHAKVRVCLETATQMGSAALYLTIDQGGHASRAMLFDVRGRALARVERVVPEIRPRPEWVEQDAEAVVRSVQDCIQQVLRSRDPLQVVSAGLACQRSSVVCWNRASGMALSPVISWQDRRAHAWLEKFEPQRTQIHASTGLMLSAHYGVSKLRWCLENLPAVQSAQQQGELCIGPLASFLIFRLTAERSFLTDPAIAARTLLFDLETHDWDARLLNLFGIPRALLPRCAPSRFDFGRIPVAGKNIPLAIVTGDQSAALFAFGPPQSSLVYINVGTGAFIQYPCVGHLERDPALLTSVVLDDRGTSTYVIEATINGAGSALQWIQQQLELADLEASLAGWLDRPGEPPLFLNGISGLAAPFWIANFSSQFIGGGEPWQQVVAVAESIVFLLQVNLERFRQLAQTLQHIVISGGVAQIDGLCQRLADISHLPVFRPMEYEATSRGLAYLLVEPTEPWREADGGTWFRPGENPPFAARYQRWRTAMERAVARLSPEAC